MSLYDKASLALIPSGTKASKLYSVLPANGDGDFTHDRNLTTATRVNKDGLIETVAEDVPRLDYPLLDGVVQDCPVLLLEPSRTNSLTYSTLAFNGGSIPTGWTVGFGTGTFSHTETTYKGQGAVKHTQITTGRSYLAETINLSTFTTYTVRVEFDRDNSSGIDDDDFILSTVAIDSSFAKRWSDVDDNGVLEVQFTTGADASGELRIGFGVSGNEDGGKTIVFSMPQIEAGSYATSYIPTEGSPETRSADTCNGAGTSAEFNDTESSLFVELQGLAEDNTNKYISISDGGGSPYTNSLSIQYRNNGTLRIFHNGLDFADAIFIGGSSFDLTENHKIAIRFKQNDMAVYIDGVSQSLNGSFVYQSISGLNTLRFEQPNGGNNFYGKVKQLMVFNEALSDSELQTLTS